MTPVHRLETDTALTITALTVADLRRVLEQFPDDLSIRLNVFGHTANLRYWGPTDCTLVNCSPDEGQEFLLLGSTADDRLYRG